MSEGRMTLALYDDDGEVQEIPTIRDAGEFFEWLSQRRFLRCIETERAIGLGLVQIHALLIRAELGL